MAAAATSAGIFVNGPGTSIATITAADATQIGQGAVAQGDSVAAATTAAAMCSCRVAAITAITARGTAECPGATQAKKACSATATTAGRIIGGGICPITASSADIAWAGADGTARTTSRSNCADSTVTTVAVAAGISWISIISTTAIAAGPAITAKVDARVPAVPRCSPGEIAQAEERQQAD